MNCVKKIVLLFMFTSSMFTSLLRADDRAILTGISTAIVSSAAPAILLHCYHECPYKQGIIMGGFLLQLISPIVSGLVAEKTLKKSPATDPVGDAMMADMISSGFLYAAFFKFSSCYRDWTDALLAGAGVAIFLKSPGILLGTKTFA